MPARILLLVVGFGFGFCFTGSAQEPSDNEFTKTVLSRKNALKYRVAPGKFLRSEAGAKFLDLTAQQTKSIETTYKQSSNEIENLERQMRNVETPNERKELSRLHTVALRRSRVDLLNILTVPQRKLLAQRSFQKYVSDSGSLGMYLHTEVIKSIGLNESQKIEMSKTVNDAGAKYLEEFIALNKRYHQKLLNEVDDSIRKKVEPVVGEPWFRFQLPGKSVLSKNLEDKK